MLMEYTPARSAASWIDQIENINQFRPILQGADAGFLDDRPFRDGIGKRDAQFDDIRPGSLQLQNKLLCGVQAGVARGHKRNQRLAALLLQFLKCRVNPVH